jgi:histidinol dehydrogenase
MRLRILDGPKRDRYVQALEQRGATDLAEVEPAVRRIVRDVQRNGDRALRRYAAKWDGLGKGESLRVPEDELHEAWKNISRNYKTRSSRPRKIFAATASGKNRKSGSAKFIAEFPWANLFARWSLWAAMFQVDAIRCPRRC